MTDALAVTRRQFALGAGAMVALGLGGGRAVAQEAATRTITTSVGTYDIPADPQRVIAVDARLDLEPAVALGLPIVGFSLREKAQPWIPLAADVPFIGSPPARELVLSYEPDLIVCTDLPGTEQWPIDKLSDVAPVLPVDYELSWNANLTRMGEWLGREDKAAAFIAEYQAELEAAQARHADAIANKKVAAVWFEPDSGEIQVLLGENTKNVTLAGQVLSDLGGKTVGDDVLGEYGVVSLENAGNILGDVDAFMMDGGDNPALVEALQGNEMWKRLPAVAAGKVLVSSGIFYGGCYSAKRLVSEWDKLYAMLA